jgi:hypothetical protein
MTGYPFAPGIAILVDCWSHLSDQIYNKTWANIENTIKEKNIQTVVLATHEYDITTHWPTEWFINTHDIFFNGNHNRDSWVKSLPYSIGSAADYCYQTAPDILNLKTHALKLMLHDSNQLKWYLKNITPHITNIWYFGCHWDICLKDRPIGYMHMKSFCIENNINILTDTQCVVTEDNLRPENVELSRWQHIVNGIYQHKVA